MSEAVLTAALTGPIATKADYVCTMSFGRGEFRNPPDGVLRLAHRMGELGVKTELELYDSGHVEVALALHAEGLLSEPLQFSLVLGVVGGMAATPANLVSLVARIPPGSVWQVIGIGRNNLAMTLSGWPWAATPARGWRTR